MLFQFMVYNKVIQIHTHTHSFSYFSPLWFITGHFPVLYSRTLFIHSIYNSFREGNGTPFQYSCLGNPMDGGAWQAIVHGAAKSQTRLSDFTFTFHFSLSCIGEVNGNPLQCSCLENPRDRGAWWAAVCGVAQSRTRLTQLSSSSSSMQQFVSANLKLPIPSFPSYPPPCQSQVCSLCL